MFIVNRSTKHSICLSLVSHVFVNMWSTREPCVPSRPKAPSLIWDVSFKQHPKHARNPKKAEPIATAKPEAKLQPPFSAFAAVPTSSPGVNKDSFVGSWTEVKADREKTASFLQHALGIGMIQRAVMENHTLRYVVTKDGDDLRFVCKYPIDQRVFETNTSGKEYKQEDPSLGTMTCRSTFHKGTLYTERKCPEMVVEDVRSVVNGKLVVAMTAKDATTHTCVRRFKKK